MNKLPSHPVKDAKAFYLTGEDRSYDPIHEIDRELCPACLSPLGHPYLSEWVCPGCGLTETTDARPDPRL